MIPHTHRNVRRYAAVFALFAWGLMGLAGCKTQDQGTGAPPPAEVVQVPDMNLLTIDQNDLQKFALVTAERVELAPELNATATVSPDVSREVPVITLANGRVIDVKVRLGDDVKKGQLLFRVQSPDITNAFDAYLKAVNDEQLANRAYVRAEDLFKHGAISQAMLEQADDAERNAKADLDAAGSATADPRCGQESSQQRGRCACPDLRRHHHPEHHQCRRCGRGPFRLGDCLHHCRPQRTSGSSAMCTKTTFPSCNWVRKQCIKLNAYPDRPRQGPRQRHRTSA